MTYANFRFYSIVAGGYLSPLQAGIQSSHAVGDMSCLEDPQYKQWAQHDKVMIVCSAFNSKGVLQAFADLTKFSELFSLPLVVFCEDEESLNGAATACGILVPECFYNVEFERNFDRNAPKKYSVYSSSQGEDPVGTYVEGSPEFEFVSLLKSYPLFK